MENPEPESRYEMWNRLFEESAIEFAKLCLLRDDAYITHDDDADRLHLGSTPMIIAKHATRVTDIHYDDIAHVLPVVTDWCRINCVLFAVYFDPEGFHCTFQADRTTPQQVFETKQHENLCGLLLMGCVAVAETMDEVRAPMSADVGH